MNWYALDQLGRFLTGTFYNLGFLGYGRNGEQMQIDGHYTVVIDTVNLRFITWKDSDYGGLTWTKPVEQHVLNLNQYERKFLNDIIYDKLSFSAFYKYDVHKKIGQNWIFFDERLKENKVYNEAVELLLQNKGSKYYHRRISPMVQLGDIVKDTTNGEIFEVFYYHDIQYINKNSQFKIVRRFREVNKTAFDYGWV